MNSTQSLAVLLSVIVGQLAWAGDLTQTHRTVFGLTALALLAASVIFDGMRERDRG